jgi:hypothetical protein
MEVTKMLQQIASGKEFEKNGFKVKKVSPCVIRVVCIATEQITYYSRPAQAFYHIYTY